MSSTLSGLSRRPLVSAINQKVGSVSRPVAHAVSSTSIANTIPSSQLVCAPLRTFSTEHSEKHKFDKFDGDEGFRPEEVMGVQKKDPDTDELLTSLTDTSMQEIYEDSMHVNTEYRQMFDETEHFQRLRNEEYNNEAETAHPIADMSLEELLRGMGIEDPAKLLKDFAEHDRRRLEFAQRRLADADAAFEDELDDGDFETEIAPGTTTKDLLKAGVPARDIIEYSRNLAAEGLVKPSYEGVNLKRLGKEAMRQRESLEAEGKSGEYRTFQQIQEDEKHLIPPEDLRDLEEYYSHFDEFKEGSEEVEEDFDSELEVDGEPKKSKVPREKLNPAQFPEDTVTSKALRTFSRTVPMDEPLPKELQKRVNLLLSDAHYKKGRDDHFFLNDLEIWYIANRLPVVFSILKRILTEIRHRIPAYKPVSVMEFAAGASPGLWAVRDVFYQDFARYTCVERDGRLALMGQQLTADLGVHIFYRPKLVMENKDDNNNGAFNDYNKNKSRRDKKKTSKSKRGGFSSADAKRNMEEAEREARMNEKKDLVIVPYALSKQPNKEYRRMLLESLWEQVNPQGGLLVLLESAENGSHGFNVVREARDYLLKTYPKASVDDTRIVDVKESIEDTDKPVWAQSATKKAKQAVEAAPSASSILPCAHDRPCPMLTMQKLHKEFLALRKLGRDQNTPVKLPRVPVTVCKFGQRMLRGPMPKQSPLQDLKIPKPLGDAVLENFSYVVMRRGMPPPVTEDAVKFDVKTPVDAVLKEAREATVLTNEEELEARQLAMNVFGAKSVENEERMEALQAKVIKKKVAPLGKYDRINADVENEEKKEAAMYFDAEGNIRMDKLQQLADEMGVELNDETVEIFKSELDAKYRPKINPKKEFSANRWARIVSPPLKRGGHVIMDVCTPMGEIERRTVGREGVGSHGFKQARVGKWGDVWPYKKAITMRELREQEKLESLRQRLNVSDVSEAVEKLDEMKRLFSPALGKEDLDVMGLYHSTARAAKQAMTAIDEDEDGNHKSDVQPVEEEADVDDIIAQVEAAIMEKQRALEELKKLKAATSDNKSKPSTTSAAAASSSTGSSLSREAALREMFASAAELAAAEGDVTEGQRRDVIDDDIDSEMDDLRPEDLRDYELQREQFARMRAAMGGDSSSSGAREDPLKRAANQWLSLNSEKDMDTTQREIKGRLLELMTMDETALDQDDEVTDTDFEDAFDVSRNNDLDWNSNKGDDTNIDFESIGGALDSVDETSTVQGRLKANRARRGKQDELDYEEYVKDTEDGTVISIDVEKQQQQQQKQQKARRSNKRHFSTAAVGSGVGPGNGMFHRGGLSSSLSSRPIPSLLTLRNNMSTLTSRALSNATKASLTGTPLPVTSVHVATSMLVSRAFSSRRSVPKNEDELARYIANMEPEDINVPKPAPTRVTPEAPKKRTIVKTQVLKDTRTNPNLKGSPFVDPFVSHRAPDRIRSVIDDVIHGPKVVVKPADLLAPTSALDASTNTNDLINNQFRFDGVMGLTGEGAQMKAFINARKIKRMAGIDPDTNLPSGIYKVSADAARIPHIEATANPVVNDDPRAHNIKGKWDEGILKRDSPPAKLPELTLQSLVQRKDQDEYETYYTQLYDKAQKDTVTRTDDMGVPLKGELETTMKKPDRTYSESYQELQRKYESRVKRRLFRERIENGKKEAIEARGGTYIPPTTGDHREMRAQLNAIGTRNDTQLKTKEERLKHDIAKLKAERAEKKIKNLMYTGLDLRDTKPVELQPSLKAKTPTEKRASMAVIENPDEYEARKEAEEAGMDLSLTALLTNKDGFGPKMDPLTGRLPVKEVDVPAELEMFRAEDVEDLLDYADAKSVDKARAIIAAARAATKNAQGRPLKLKLKRAVKDEEDDIELPTLPDNSDEKYQFSIAPMSESEIMALEAKKNLETTLLLDDGTPVDKSVVDALSQAKVPSSSFLDLAHRFKDLVKKEEERELMEAHSFEPVEVPSMQDSWSVKNRAPDNMNLAKGVSEDFARGSRSYDRLVADFQEAELLERLGAFRDISLPKATYDPLDDVDLTREMSVKELREVLEFERVMQEATEKVYTTARKKIKQQVKAAATEDVFPEEFAKEAADIDDSINPDEIPTADVISVNDTKYRNAINKKKSLGDVFGRK